MLGIPSHQLGTLIHSYGGLATTSSSFMLSIDFL